MSDQAQKLRAKVNENKLSNLIDDIKNIKDIQEIYSRAVLQSNNKCKVLSLISAKGGVGKTLCLYSIVEILKSYNKRVAIIDMNKYYSDISLYYRNPNIVNITKKNILENVSFSLLEIENIEQYIYQLTPEIQSVEWQLIKIILYQAKLSEFEYVVIDTPVSSPDILFNISTIVDKTIIVSNVTFNSLYNTNNLLQRIIKMLDNKIIIDLIFNNIDKADNSLIMQFIESVGKSEKIEINEILKIKNDKILKVLEELGVTAALHSEKIKSSEMYEHLKKYIETEILDISSASASQKAQKNVLKNFLNFFK
ncbi:MAG TPA: ParA family protein [bacterium]|nr:ParA family protein [bacterium]